MIDTSPLVKASVVESLNQLTKDHYFSLNCFNTGEPTIWRADFVSATDDAKAAAVEFLDGLRPEGSTNPVRAFERACACQPDVSFFVADGDLHKSLLSNLRDWNRDKKIRIFTTAFLYPAGADLLERISLEHGGEYARVRQRPDEAYVPWRPVIVWTLLIAVAYFARCVV